MEGAWKPLAYRDARITVPLPEHLRRVAGFILSTGLSELLSAAGVRLGLGEALPPGLDMARIGVLAGLLHDIGKASRLYHERWGSKKFYGHEYVSALLLLRAADNAREGRENWACLYMLLANTVARHHSAMASRAPPCLKTRPKTGYKLERLCEARKRRVLFRTVQEALSSLEALMVEHVLEEAFEPLVGLLGERLVERVTRDLVEAAAALPRGSYASSRIAERIIEEIADAPMAACGGEYGVGYPETGDQTPGADPRWMKALYTLSGVLIVADILAAYAERSLLPGASPTGEVPTMTGRPRST